MILINHHGTCDISFVKPGSFLFQVLWEHDLPTDQLYADPQGTIYGAEFKLWRSRCFDLLHSKKFPTILMDFAPKPVASIAGPRQGGGLVAGLDNKCCVGSHEGHCSWQVLSSFSSPNG